MLQVVQYQKNGVTSVQETPAPGCPSGGVLVQTAASLISAGTERTSVKNAQGSLLDRARAQPDQVKAVFDKIKKDGIAATYQTVKSKLESLKAFGYSAAGVVVESRCDTFVPGDRVACAGAQYAHHAEMIAAPKNLVVKIPDNVSFEAAAYTTLGAIALQGVRQADVRLGETVVVIGLGLLGQITVQLLKASGCRVVGMDVDESLFDLALQFGCDAVFSSSKDSVSSIRSFTRGIGSDAVVITASTSSNEPLEISLDIARKKSPIVIVGAVPMNIPRSPFYEKELDLRISCSYGPGRYDPNYESNGHDYPIAYVRWTENRNMTAFLDLISQKKIAVEPLTTHTFPIQDATKAYDIITGAVQEKHLGIILNYPERKDKLLRVISTGKIHQELHNIRVGFIGLGAFAQSMIMPPLLREKPELTAVSTGTPINAKSAAQQYGFLSAATDSISVVDDDRVNVVFCASRHDSHAKYVVRAVEKGKAVFVEKPLCITIEELQEIDNAVAKHQGRVMVGLNRRFSDSFRAMKKFFAHRSSPLSMNYRVNSGYIPAESWIQDPSQGGRIIGEGCHFIDCMMYLSDAFPVRVFAEQISSGNHLTINADTVSISMKFSDGSIGTLHYFSNGDSSVEKEYCEAFCEGSTAIMKNFSTVLFSRGKKTKKVGFNGLKGHNEEIAETMKSIRNGTEMPIPYSSIRAGALAAFAAVESLATGMPVLINYD